MNSLTGQGVLWSRWGYEFYPPTSPHKTPKRVQAYEVSRCACRERCTVSFVG